MIVSIDTPSPDRRSAGNTLLVKAIFMAEARVERRLAAILAADVAGYSRLISIDEEALSQHSRRTDVNSSILTRL